MLKMRRLAALVLCFAMVVPLLWQVTPTRAAVAWSLAEAAKPYKGITINVIGLDRPSYVAEKALIPEFEKETGINVTVTTYPYESTLEAETLNFTSGTGKIDGVLTDLIWTGLFVTSHWVHPVSYFASNPKLADPALDVNDFIEVWRKAFEWDNVLYGLPFDSYSGLLYYNKRQLAAAGFTRPPRTWDELYNVYGPKLTDPAKGQYAFALQSRRGETQTCDSFARFLWAFGGRFLDPATFKPDVLSPASVRGIEFRQRLMKYMPPGIVSDDHGEVVQLLAQGKVSMITEWSSFYTTLVDPSTSTIANDLGVTTEPRGPAGLSPAFGGFAYMVSTQVPPERQAATWLFIQWLTSKQEATPLIQRGAVVARISADTDPALQAKFPYLKPMVESWQSALYYFRPRFPAYPQISEVVANWGTQIQLGQVSVRGGLEKISSAISDIMQKAGYYTGKEPKVQ
jgi:multiple sugar transport system substrate-binding protein